MYKMYRKGGKPASGLSTLPILRHFQGLFCRFDFGFEREPERQTQQSIVRCVCVGCWSITYRIEEFGFEGSRTVEQVEALWKCRIQGLDDSYCEFLR